MTPVKQQQLERSQGRPGPPVTGAASKTPATSTAITVTFDVFQRAEACEREGTLRQADRSANDGDRVRHRFGSGDLRGARQELVEELKLVVERLNTYLQLHYMLLTLFEKQVRNLLVEAIDHGLDEGFHELVVQADEFQGNHEDGAPMPGTGDVVQVPQVQAPSDTAESDSMSSLAERTLGWKAAAPAPSAGGEKRKGAQPSRAAKAKAKKSKNTSGVGFFPRHGRAGRRGTVIPAAATGANTTTSTVPPTQPALPHPPPHQVSLDSSSRSSNRSSNLNSSPAAAAATGGLGGLGQQPSVANFSRTVGGGRGGGGGCGDAKAGRGGAGRGGF